MRSPHTAMKSSSHSPQLEKAHVQQWRPNAALKKKKKKKILLSEMVCRASERKRYEVRQKTQVLSLHTSENELIYREREDRRKSRYQGKMSLFWNTLRRGEDTESQKAFGKVGLEWWRDNSDRDIWESIIYKGIIPDAENEWPSSSTEEHRKNKIPRTQPAYSLGGRRRKSGQNTTEPAFRQARRES